jgi:hypothetical protein
MRKIHTLFILLSFLFVFSFKSIAQNDSITKGATLMLTKKFHDFGDVMYGNKVRHTFTFINTGSDTLKITKIVTTCGCTVPESYDKSVPPGGSGTIVVEFNSLNKFGVVTRSLSILSNAVNEKPHISLMIRANVIN